MVSRLSPIFASLRQRLLGQRAMRELATRTDIIQEESVSYYPPAIYLPDQLEKVTATPSDTSWDWELTRLGSGCKRHAPLIRYEFEDVLVFETGFTVGGASFGRYGPLPLASLIGAQPRDLARAHYAGNYSTSRYFGHWLRDACATALLTRDNESLILPYGKEWRHAPEYIRVFSFPTPEQLPVRVARLAYHSDYAQNENRTRRYGILRDRLRNALLHTAGHNPGRRVFLRRRGGEARNINDEPALIDRLVKEGFHIVDTANMNIEEIMRASLDADLCVTMEGSHQAHAYLFLRRGGALINIQPSDRFNNMARDYAPNFGFQYGFVVGNREGAGYTVDVGALMRTIDLAQRAEAAHC